METTVGMVLVLYVPWKPKTNSGIAGKPVLLDKKAQSPVKVKCPAVSLGVSEGLHVKLSGGHGKQDAAPKKLT